MADSRHRITIETVDNRGRNFLIGLAVLFLLYRVWVTGSLLHAIGFATGSPENAGGYSSVTGVLLPIIVQIVVVIGAVTAALATGFWAVVWDFGTGVYEMLVSWRAKNLAVASATEAAKQEAMREVSFAPGAATLQEADIPRTESGEPITLADVADAIQAVNDELQLVKRSYEISTQATHNEIIGLRDQFRLIKAQAEERLPLFDQEPKIGAAIDPPPEEVNIEAGTKSMLDELVQRLEEQTAARIEALEEQIAAVHRLATKPRTVKATRQPAAPKPRAR